MTMRWSLKELYPSFSSPSFRRDLARLAEEVAAGQRWSAERLVPKADRRQVIEEYLTRRISFAHLEERLGVFASLSLAVNTADAAARRALETVERIVADAAEDRVRFARWLAAIPEREFGALVRRSPLIGAHRFHLEEIRRNARHLLSEREEVLFAKMRITGSTAWSQLQNTLTATLMVPVRRGKKVEDVPLSVARSYAYDADPKLRQAAYEGELAAYPKVEEAAAACLNAIKGEVIATAQMRGFASPLDMTLYYARMDRPTLDALLTAMRGSLPAFRKYLRAKAALLGHRRGLPFYDLFAPIGANRMRFTYEEAHRFIVEHFSRFSPALGAFADTAFRRRWIDAEPRKGKVGGAFCYNIHAIGESRILANFTGSLNHVVTLAHELGHAYHGHCLRGESPLNSDYPMPLAETASIFCETLVTQAALEKASRAEQRAILEGSLQTATQVIADIYSRYLFETAIFAYRAEAVVPVEDLKDLMLDAQRKAYGDGLDPETLHPYMWLCKPHYYDADHNFYNFPYAFGLLFAKGLYAEYLRRGPSFVADYDRLLAETGKNDVAAVAALMGVDVRDPRFWRRSLALVIRDIETFCVLQP